MELTKQVTRIWRACHVRSFLTMGAACCIGSAAGSTTFDGSFLSAAAGLFFAHTQGVLSPWSVGMALLLGAVIMYVALILATPKEVQMTAAECTYITAEEPNDPTPLPLSLIHISEPTRPY